MRLGPAARDSALAVPSVFALVLLVAFALKAPPHVAVWLTAVGVIIARFLLVALGISGRGRTPPG